MAILLHPELWMESTEVPDSRKEIQKNARGVDRQMPNERERIIADYHSAVGTLSAERYGVPQTRKRAFLLASLDGPVALPAATHRSYNARRRDVPAGARRLRP